MTNKNQVNQLHKFGSTNQYRISNEDIDHNFDAFASIPPGLSVGTLSVNTHMMYIFFKGTEKKNKIIKLNFCEF